MPTIGVSVVVINNLGQILLTKRTDLPVWCLPGGGIEHGESIAQAAIREVHEETGLDIVLTRLVGLYSRPKWANGGDHAVLFTAFPTTEIFTPQEAEVADIGYFEPSELPQMLLWWQRYYIRDALVGLGGAVAKTLDITWPFEPGLTAQQIHDKEMRGEIPAETLSYLFVEPATNKEVREVGHE